MKNLRFFTKHFFPLGLMLLMATNSCKNEGSVLDVRPDSQTRDSGISCETYQQYEQYGTFFYEHLKYNMANITPEDLLPVEYRAEFMQKFDSLSTLTQGWQLQDILDHYVSEGTLSTDFSQDIAEVDSLLQELLTGAMNYLETKTAIEQLTVSKTINPNISCADKNSIVAFNSTIKNLLIYLNEIGQLDFSLQSGENPMQFRGCGVIAHLKCILAGAVVGTLTGAAATVFISVATSQVAVLVVGSIVGGLLGIYAGLSPEICCGEVNYDCKAVMGVSLNFLSCNLAAVYKPFGFGVDDENLEWVNLGGTPELAITPTTNPGLAITQNSSTTPVTTTITSVCKDQTKNTSTPFERDISHLVKSVLGITITGPTEVDPPSGVSYTYSGFGLFNNANYSTQWQVTNGTIVSSTFTGVTIIWDTDMTTGFVNLIVTNTCPGGETKQFTLKVTDGGPIP